MPDRDEPRPSTREVAAEDFLYHLHKGSELLQDNRVHAAKAELEQALALQPSDPKGQDLLGIVYFRLGLYPRAIQIYEKLIQAHPEAVEPRINLALSYLKTGQPAQARFELEKALEQNPKHQRAWGYLGLAFQRMGDYERASQAFAAGGHDAMARRLLDMTGSNAGKYSMLQPAAEQPAEAKAEVRRAASEAVNALDRGSAGFRPDSDLPRIPSGTWSAIEPGREMVPTIPAPPLVRSLVNEHRKVAADEPGAPKASGAVGPTAATVPSMHAVHAPAPVSSAQSPRRAPAADEPAKGATRRTLASSLEPQEGTGADGAERRTAAPHVNHVAKVTMVQPASTPTSTVVQPPEGPFAFARERLLVFPRDLPIAHHASGVVLVQAQRGFAARIDALRSISANAGTATKVLKRHARGRTFDEPLGGQGAPLVEIEGRCDLVLGAQPGRRLHALALGEEPIYLREDVLVGFDLVIGYENGRLPAGDGDAIAMVQLRGRGGVVLALPEHAAAFEVTASRPTSLRAMTVLGWMGRLLPRTLPPSEAPAAAHGFVTFGGEGMVLIDGR